jgi:hypothetical protein
MLAFYDVIITAIESFFKKYIIEIAYLAYTSVHVSTTNEGCSSKTCVGRGEGTWKFRRPPMEVVLVQAHPLIEAANEVL